MDFIIVGENKLKIMLDFEEMTEYNLTSSELDYRDPAVRDSFWKIIDLAKAECGFDVSGDKILIQFYPSKTIGEIFITKLGAISKSAEDTISASKRVAMLESNSRIYKFECREHLSEALVRHNTKDTEIRLFEDELGCLYLFTEERTGNGAPLSEYACELPQAMDFYILEHFKEIGVPD